MTGKDAVPARLPLSSGQITALSSAVVACVVLLGVIAYCPSYEAGKVSLLYLWTTTFWNDVYNQITGLLAGASKETQSGEASSSEWNYCLMVPFIVAWLVWRQLPKLRELPLTGNSRGYALLGFGFFVYLVGFLCESYYIGFVAMELVYAGLVVLFLGWDALKLLLFPIAFMMFMWPYNFMEDVALDLRMHMSALSHHVLQLMSVPNMLEGTAIKSLPGSPTPFAIDIADPCSGIRSLFALVMIAAVYGFIAFDKLWQQVAIVVISVPLVFIGNLVRIIILTLGTIHFGETFALGNNEHPSWFHEFAGYLVYFINFGGLIAIGSLLAKVTAPSPVETDNDRNHPDQGNDENADPTHARS